MVHRALRGIDKHAIDTLKRSGVPTYYSLIEEQKATPMRKISHAPRVSGVAIMQPE